MILKIMRGNIEIGMCGCYSLVIGIISDHREWRGGFIRDMGIYYEK